MKFNDNYRTSVFSGLYKLLTVTSEFKNGQFIQQLNLIRLPYQANYDYVNQPQSSSEQRNSDITPDNAAIIGATKNAPLNIGKSPNLPSNDANPARLQPIADAVQIGVNALTKNQIDLAQVNNTALTKIINSGNQPVQVSNLIT